MADTPSPFSDPWLARRMHDRTAIHRAETELHPAVRIAVEDYLRQARARLLGEQAPRLRFATGDDPPDLQAFPDDSLWSRIVTGRIAPTIRSLFTRAFARFGQRERAAPPADDFADTLPGQLAGFPRRVWERLRTAVTEGLARGESAAELRERVRTLMTLEEWDGQVMTMTRTATMTALNAGAMSGALDEQARTGEQWIKVWQCVPGDTRVSAFGATHGARRHYKGALVRIRTRSGTAVSLTPEHRVLTGRGWIRAQDVDQTDHLFRVGDADPARTPHVQDTPPLIGQVIDALADRAAMVKVGTLAVGPLMDGQTSHSHVEVVPADDDLTAHLETPLLQKEGQLRTVTADVLGASAFLERSAPCGCSCSTRLRGCGGTYQESGLGLGPPRNTSVTQDALDGVGGTAEPGRDRTERGTCLVQGDDGRLVQVTAPPDLQGSDSGSAQPLGTLGVPVTQARTLRARTPHPEVHQPAPDRRSADTRAGSDPLAALTRCVSPDDVVEIQRLAFEGHVYDLSTTGEWYTANHLLVHNSTSDERTRHTHRDADGQQRGLTEPFRVGGHRFQFPGDPQAPPQELINCRCSMRLGPLDDPSLTASPTPQEAP